MNRRVRRARVAAGVASAACLLAIVTPGTLAQQTAPKPVLPVAAETVAEHPDEYVGQLVSLTAAVKQILSPTAFSIEQNRTGRAATALLVIAPTLTAAVDRGSYVTVIGEVVRFDPEDLARRVKGFAVDLGPEAAAGFLGQPVVLATSVIDKAMVDVARRLPPPLTPEEDAFDKVMKRVGPSFASLRQAVDVSDAAAVKAQSAILTQAFADAQAFWKRRGKTDAIGWAQEARTASESIGRAAAGGSWHDVQTLATGLGRACQSCHGVYRERLDDGTYRIKADAK